MEDPSIEMERDRGATRSTRDQDDRPAVGVGRASIRERCRSAEARRLRVPEQVRPPRLLGVEAVPEVDEGVLAALLEPVLEWLVVAVAAR